MDDTKEIFEGPAVRGPYEGLELSSRFPRGIVFVDKASNTVYIYDYDLDDREFYGRWATPRPLDTPGRKRAAEGSEYDVRAAIEEEHDKWRL